MDKNWQACVDIYCW